MKYYILIIALSSLSCGRAKADEPATMVCETITADGLLLKKCVSDTDICYIYKDSVSCRAL